MLSAWEQLLSPGMKEFFLQEIVLLLRELKKSFIEDGIAMDFYGEKYQVENI